jgi:hypothetical protein
MAKKRQRKGKKARKQRRAKPQTGSLPPIPDRRVMEGILRQLVPGTGGSGTSLEAAQEIMYQAFEAESPRRRVALARKKKRELTEEAALEIALRDHPDWRRARNKGELPDEVLSEDGQPMSPRAHFHIHAVVERQLASDDPKGVVAIAQALEQLGVSRHDVRHEIGTVIAEHMWYMTKEGCRFDEGRYLEWLAKP